jgi:hypothetical protein
MLWNSSLFFLNVYFDDYAMEKNQHLMKCEKLTKNNQYTSKIGKVGQKKID